MLTAPRGGPIIKGHQRHGRDVVSPFSLRPGKHQELSKVSLVNRAEGQRLPPICASRGDGAGTRRGGGPEGTAGAVPAILDLWPQQQSPELQSIHEQLVRWQTHVIPATWRHLCPRPQGTGQPWHWGLGPRCSRTRSDKPVPWIPWPERAPGFALQKGKAIAVLSVQAPL